MLIAAYHEPENGLTNAGHVYLFSGATGDLLASLTSPTPEQNGAFGTSVAWITDADGNAVLLVGTLEHTPDGIGRVHLFDAATGAWRSTLDSPNPESNSFFGVSIAGVSDQNGDGTGDVLIGARGEDGTTRNAGRAYLFSGATDALLTTYLSGAPEDNGYFGTRVAAVPDTDGDGRDDLLISANQENNNAGRAYLFASLTTVRNEPPALRHDATLQSLYPNPFHQSTTVRFMLPEAGVATVDVLDVVGRRVDRLLEGPLAAGDHNLTWTADGVPSGCYFVRLRTDTTVQVRQVTRLK